MPVPEGSAGRPAAGGPGLRGALDELDPRSCRRAREIAGARAARGVRHPQAAEADLRAAHDVLEDAFLEWSVRERETFEDFPPPRRSPRLRAVEPARRRRPHRGGRRRRRDPPPPRTPVAYVARLAVRRDQRGRGLAQALLVDSFALAREHGATVSELSTDSRTGALGLYEKVGMGSTARLGQPRHPARLTDGA